MGEEAYEETVLAADTGTITIRGGYGRKKVWLGLAKGNQPEEHPDINIALTPRQQHELIHTIGIYRNVVEWKVLPSGGWEFELLDDEDQPIILMTICPIGIEDDLLSRWRCSVFDQKEAGVPEPVFRVTTESSQLAKRLLDEWWMLHSFEYGASI